MKKRFTEVYFNAPLYSSYTYALPDTMGEAVAGKRVTVDLNGRKMTAFAVREWAGDESSLNYKVKPILKIQDDEPLFGEAQLRLAEWIGERYFCSIGEALSLMIPGGKRIVDSFSLWDGASSGEESPVQLSEDQKTAVETVFSEDSLFFYLYGVTGSGKTEVYLEAAARTLSQGKGVLYLVPEIALTHQLTNLVRSRFGDRVSVIHSLLTPAQKYTQWRRIISGEADFVIGARSAVFAPLPEPGLIILDEEHESSYKSHSGPRYHARQVAMYIARQNHARLIMGSATPSVEAYYAMRCRSVIALRLSRRVAGGARPRFRVIDMRGRKSLLSSELIHAIRQTLSEKRQVILFLNRRGFSHSFRCRTCGYEFHCRSCSLPMTYHKRENCFICHCCGRRQAAVRVCPECGSLDIGYGGVGTEKIEEEIAAVFPDVPVARVDRDTVHNGKELGQILERFRIGETGILLGTQMIAKGLNFPQVKLVGIVSVDNLLGMADFRSSEKAFAMITQVAGRTGRYSRDGEVLIQTENGSHPALVHAVRGEEEAFYREELEMRKVSGFPPYSRLIHVVSCASDNETASSAINYFSAILIREGVPESVVMGPAPAPVSRINGKSRYHCLIRSPEVRRFSAAIRTASAMTLKEFRKCRIEIDADPVSIE